MIVKILSALDLIKQNFELFRKYPDKFFMFVFLVAGLVSFVKTNSDTLSRVEALEKNTIEYVNKADENIREINRIQHENIMNELKKIGSRITIIDNRLYELNKKGN